MKKMMIAKVATPKNTARIKKMITAAVTALCVGVMFSMTVFADGASVDTSSFLAAHVEHGADAADDQHNDGKQHIPQACLRVTDGLLFLEGAEPAVAIGFELSFRHRAVVEIQEDEADYEDDHEQRVEVERNGLDKQLDAVDAKVLRNAGNGGGPGRDRCDHADGRSGCVNNESEFRAGDVLAVGKRAHDGAHGQAVEVVVHEDKAA